MTGTSVENSGDISKAKFTPGRTRGIILSYLFKEEPPDAPGITKSKSNQGMTLDSQKRMKADLLYLGAGYTVSRSKPFQGGGNVTGTETVPEPKLSQISNNCHNCLNRATHDQGSFKEVHLNNHKELWHETNFHRSPAQPFITGAWNYRKSSRRKKL
ncbi:hypothetical protein F2Q69_00001333 [Brassica cretica]|uniref:Uncharacterized protein n=1 Tax=Brassica cretica TaxID=69181 RepID=A0A8S9PMN3_BRACR|nr:hypothetical protein F2Q69_00001333 [Brassica cretica]